MRTLLRFRLETVQLISSRGCCYIIYTPQGTRGSRSLRHALSRPVPPHDAQRQLRYCTKEVQGEPSGESLFPSTLAYIATEVALQCRSCFRKNVLRNPTPERYFGYEAMCLSVRLIHLFCVCQCVVARKKTTDPRRHFDLRAAESASVVCSITRLRCRDFCCVFRFRFNLHLDFSLALLPSFRSHLATRGRSENADPRCSAYKPLQ